MKNSFVLNFKLLYSKLFKYSKRCIFLLPFSIITSLLSSLVLTYLPSAIVYGVQEKFEVNFFIFLIVIFVTSYLVLEVINVVVKNVLNIDYIFVRTTYFFNNLTRKTLTYDYELLERKSTRDKRTMAFESVNTNTNGVEGYFRTFPDFLISLFALIIFLIGSSFISYYVLLIVIAGFVVQIVVSRFAVDKIYDKNNLKFNEESQRIRYLEESSLSEKDAKDIRNYSLSPFLIDKISRYKKLSEKYSFRLQMGVFLPSINVTIFSIARDLVSYAFLIYQVIDHQITPAEFTALLATVTALSQYLDTISWSIDDLYYLNKEVSNYRKYIDLKSELNHEENDLSDKLNTPFDIEIKNLTYTYEGSDKNVFSNFSLHIRPKEKLALVGLNGAGKTTLIKLICGLYKPTKGEILINGINLNDFKIEDYYKKISLVAQEIEPLAFTIKDNIVLGSKYNEKKLQSVIKESGLDNVVDRLKNKENTYLTQNFSLDGVELSGGESQKLLLARALYKDSYFIALDEPTSALDPLAESELYLKYEELIKNRTSIYVSHRLSSTKFCDRIVYIENGEIVEEGTHEELMKKKGEYYKLFSLQAKYYKEDSKNV